ncbi:MAG TPA: WD40 repeat domain-containing protein, partial [Gemmataceae bacterium]
MFHAAFSPDGKLLALADGSEVSVWDVESGKSLHDFGHTYAIWTVAFAPDGKTLASGAAYTDPVARLWDPLTGRLKASLRGHSKGIEEVAYSPDGKLLATGSQDGTVRLWDAAAGKELRKLEANDGMVYTLAFSPDGKVLATGGRTHIHFWDPATGDRLRSVKSPGGLLITMLFTPDGRTLVTRAANESKLRVWDVAAGRLTREIGVSEGSLSPDGRWLAVGDSKTGTVQI